MRWLARVFASAVVRRLALLFVAAFLAWAGIGKAHAQDYSNCYGNNAELALCPSREEAYSNAFRVATALNTHSPSVTCEWVISGLGAGRHGYRCYFRDLFGNKSAVRAIIAGAECPVNSTWDDVLKICANTVCKNAGVLRVVNPGAKGLLRCLTAGTNSDGSVQQCMFIAETIQPGQPNAGYVGWATTGKTCDYDPENPEDGVTCPAGFAKGTGTFDRDTCYPVKTCEVGEVDPVTGECPKPDTCPEGKQKAPDGSCRTEVQECPASGQVKGPDGSCVDDPNMCKTGTVRGADGTCKPDADGDGEPDEDDGTHKASDSLSCGSPPVCSGDEIMCLHAKQLWRIDCNTRKNANVILDQYCNTPPVCDQIALGEGRTNGCSAQEEAGLFLQWRQVCEAQKANDALERIAENTKGGGGSCGPGTSDTDCNGQPDWTQNPADGLGQAGLSDPGENATADDVVVEGDAIGTGGLNVTGFGYGSTCPTIPDVTINGQTLHFDTSVFCNWLRLGGRFVLIAAALLSLTIMTRGQG